MSSHDLRSLLDGVPDTWEIILRRDRGWSPVLHAWRDASEEAAAALQDWRVGRTSWEPWDEATTRSRTAFAHLLGVDSAHVTVGSQVSQLMAPETTGLSLSRTSALRPATA